MSLVRDGSKLFLGVDTESGNRTSGILSDLVNRTLRNQKNDTRPPFIEWTTLFYDKEDEYTFRNGAVKGVFFYKGTVRNTPAFLIIAVHDRILAGRIVGRSIIFEPAIYVGINSSRQSAHFCRAENILVYQNGKDFPLYWLGDQTKQMQPVYNSSFVGTHPMIIGNLMVYSHGRIFVATENDLVYASDHIYSQGISQGSQEAILSFNESTYPSSGDGFGAPSDMLSITGMASLRSSGSLEGYGDIAVFCQNGVFTIDPSLARNEWTNNRIQKTLFTGVGCSAYSTVRDNGGDVFFRDSDGNLSSLKFSSTKVGGSYNQTPFSHDIAKYLNRDTTSLIRFSRSIKVDNRMLTTCAIVQEKSILGGFHIFAKGIAVIDFQERSRDFRWDGLWTGPRVTDCCSVFANGSVKSCFISHDSDGINRIYDLAQSRGDDVNSKGPKKIVSFYSQSKIFHSNELSNTAIKRLTKHSVSYSDLYGSISVSSSVKITGEKNCMTLIDNKQAGHDGCSISSGECNNLLTYEGFGDIVTHSLCGVKEGYSFDVTTSITGSAIIVSDLISAEDSGTEPKDKKECEAKQVKQCCTEPFSYIL